MDLQTLADGLDPSGTTSSQHVTMHSTKLNDANIENTSEVLKT